MKKQQKKYKLFLLALIPVVVLSIFLFKYNNRPYIEKVLTTKEYSYLPKEAKQYIKIAYEQTGVLIPTEKNKQENMPYLNPSYVRYLSLSKEEKEKQEIIPEPYTIDYVEQNISGDSNLPSSYNIMNVNGKNFTTPLKNQAKLGLCWAFASLEQAESYLLVKNNTSYNSSSSVFSPRQVDYSTSADGIQDYDNPYGYRMLGSGGNFYMTATVASAGVSLTNESDMPYNESKDTKLIKDVLNYEKSQYYITSTITMGSMTEDMSNSAKTEYLNTIKTMIKNYGGAYVGTEAPGDTRSCSTTNTDGKLIIAVDNQCEQNSGHAMQIIGWDDNYTYKYCSGTSHSSDIANCSSSNIKTGKGAWILRNSWGDDNLIEAYPYLTYDSLDVDISSVSNMKSREEKDWDNSYGKAYYSLVGPISFDENGEVIEINVFSQNDTQEFNLIRNEMIKHISFYNYTQNATYNISITSNDTKVYDTNINTQNAGLYTIDLDENINLEGNVKVTVKSNDGYLLTNSIQLFTSNIETTPYIKTEDKTIENRYTTNTSTNYRFALYSDTRAIPSNETVYYSLFKEDGTDITDKMTVENNVVAMNNVVSNITINRSVKPGDYIIKARYNSYEYTSKLRLGILGLDQFEGSGTPANPYLVHNEMELRAIGGNSTSRTKFYKLVNNITLTGEWTPIGYDGSFFDFTGGFDGDNHTISKVKITEVDGFYAGFFGKVKANDSGTTSIKNIHLDLDINLDEKIVGGLIGYLTAAKDIEIDSIYLNGTITNNNVSSASAKYLGGLIGMVNEKNSTPGGTLTINNIYSSLKLSSTHNMGGLVGKFERNVLNNVNISNVETVGNIYQIPYNDEYLSGYSLSIGALFGELNQENLSISNYIVTGNYDLKQYDDDIMSSRRSEYFSSVNGYHIYQESEMSTKKTAHELKNSSLYTSWDDFNTYWTIVDGRIPVLKGSNFEYSTISDFELKKSQTKSITNFITPKIDATKNVLCTIEEGNDIIEIDDECNVKGLKPGDAVLHVTSNYDGYEKDVNVTVLNVYSVSYNSNNGTGVMEEALVDSGDSYIIANNEFTKDGYTFDGWNTKADGSGESYSSGDTIQVTSNITLYAKWKPNTYKLTLVSNNGSNTTQEQTYTHDQNQRIMKNTFTKTGYKFARWNTQSNGNGTSYEDEQSISITENTTLYAIWEPITYTIRFNSNDSNLLIETQVLTYGVRTNLRNNTFTKNEYHFARWNTKLDGTGTSYSDGQEVLNLTDKDNDVIDLFVQWEKNIDYKINYPNDQNKKIISGITTGTTLNEFKSNIELDPGYTVTVDTKNNLVYTGGKTKIYYNNNLIITYTNAVIGDPSGDGQIGYVDYVKVYNHIQKIRFPESNKSLLTGANLIAGDMSGDNNISYIDYVKIYNKIKELRG